MEALAVALLIITLGALITRTVQRHTKARRRMIDRASVIFRAPVDPACPGPDLGTLSWLIWQGLDA